MNEIIRCPFCGLKIKLSREYKIEPYDYPIKKIIDFMNSIIKDEEKKIALKTIIENDMCYKAEVTTKLTDSELKELVKSVMGYCDVCGRSNSSFGYLMSNGIPRLYEGPIFAGGIGPTTIEYKEKIITAYDPVPDVTVKLKVIGGKGENNNRNTQKTNKMGIREYIILKKVCYGNVCYGKEGKKMKNNTTNEYEIMKKEYQDELKRRAIRENERNKNKT